MQLRDMKVQTIGVKYHNFQSVSQVNNIVLAKCDCCTPSRWGVFEIINSHKQFFYHGYDEQYAKKLFSSHTSRSQA